MDEDRLARFELGVVEQHVLHGAEPDRRAGRLSKLTPSGTGITSRSGMLSSSRAKPSIWKPMMPATFSHRLSRPSRQALQWPQVRGAVHDHRVAGLERVTPSPTAAISPDASTPTACGILRLANAMPRKPQTSR